MRFKVVFIPCESFFEIIANVVKYEKVGTKIWLYHYNLDLDDFLEFALNINNFYKVFIIEIKIVFTCFKCASLLFPMLLYS